MNQLQNLPIFRSDLEIITKLDENNSLWYFVKDPISKEVSEFGDEEYFLCKQLDGQSSPSEIRLRFKSHFNIDLDIEQLNAFIHQLGQKGLLANDIPKSSSVLDSFLSFSPETWKKWKLFNPNKLLHWLTTHLWWFYTKFFVIISMALFLLAIAVAYNNYTILLEDLKFFFIPLSLAQTLIVFYFCINIPSQIVQGITNRHYGAGVDEFGIHLAFNFIPLFYCKNRTQEIEKKSNRNWAIFTPIYYGLMVTSLGLFCWKMTLSGFSLHTFGLILIVIGVTNTLIRLNILWPTDASYLISNWLEIPNLQTRSIAIAKNWILRRPLPEPLTEKNRYLHTLYGLLSGGITLISIALGAYFLIKLGIDNYRGYAALFILIVMITKFHKVFFSLFNQTLKKQTTNKVGKKYQGGLLMIANKFQTKRIGQMISKKCEQFLEKWNDPVIRKKIIHKLLIGGFVFIIICPYRFCPSGTFKIQPLDQQNIQTEVKGKIEAVFIKEGDWVKKGDLIAQLSKNNIQKDIDSSDEKKPALVEIRSSIDGRVVALYTDKQLGRMLEVSDQLATVEDSRNVIAEIYLNECDIGEVELAMPVKIKTWAYSGRAFTGGKVIEIASAIVNKDAIKSKWSDVEQDSDAVRILNTQGDEIARITAEFSNPNNLLKPGMTGYAKIIGRWTILGNVLTKGIFRFFRVEVWSWLP